MLLACIYIQPTPCWMRIKSHIVLLVRIPPKANARPMRGSGIDTHFAPLLQSEFCRFSNESFWFLPIRTLPIREDLFWQVCNDVYEKEIEFKKLNFVLIFGKEKKKRKFDFNQISLNKKNKKIVLVPN